MVNNECVDELCYDKVLTSIDMEWNFSLEKFVFMNRKLLPASAGCSAR